jgi:hypothetical protein
MFLSSKNASFGSSLWVPLLLKQGVLKILWYKKLEEFFPKNSKISQICTREIEFPKILIKTTKKKFLIIFYFKEKY